MLANLADRGTFCRAWLGLQCSAITGTSVGLLLLRQETGAPVVISWPDGSRASGDLQRLAERAIVEKRALAVWARGDSSSVHPSYVMVAVPIGISGEPFAAVTVAVAAKAGVVSIDSNAIEQQLRWGAGWLELLPLQRRTEHAHAVLTRAAEGIALLKRAAEHRRLSMAAISITNELAARLHCDRVSIGVTDRRGAVRLQAMSHSASFQRNSQLVDAIENAMEEALDEGTSTAFPPIPSTERRLSVAHRDLANIVGGRSAVASVVLPRGDGGICGAITLERHRDAPFDADALRLAEHIAELIGPVIDLQVEASRWIAGSLVDWARDGCAALFGPRRPTLKLLAAGIAVLGIWLAVAEGEHRITAKAVLEGEVQRAAVVPFDGFLMSAPGRAGDTVNAGDLLAVLEDKDLVLDRLKWQAERDKLVQKRRDALAAHDRAAVNILAAELLQAEVQLALAEQRLSLTQIRAPFDGLIVSGDLSQMLGSPVQKGRVLFEIAPLDAYRLVVQVDDRDLRYLHTGQSGAVALAGLPDKRVPVTVFKITPVAIADDGRNYFRVEGQLGERNLSLRPGMEGVAKIDVGSRSLLWIWTYRLAEWVRLTAWRWQP